MQKIHATSYLQDEVEPGRQLGWADHLGVGHHPDGRDGRSRGGRCLATLGMIGVEREEIGVHPDQDRLAEGSNSLQK